jgi:hypothetical protein
MTNRLTARDVEILKSEGRYAHAGALSFILDLGSIYGCHYGMRSTRDQAMREFVEGSMIARTYYEFGPPR